MDALGVGRGVGAEEKSDGEPLVGRYKKKDDA